MQTTPFINAETLLVYAQPNGFTNAFIWGVFICKGVAGLLLITLMVNITLRV